MALYATGDRVTQQQYGDGTVIVCNEYHTVVEFDAHGSRTFATHLVRLESCSSLAPPKPPKRPRRAKAAKAN